MRGGGYHCFPLTSFSATLSNMASARCRLSLWFTFSSAISRLVSNTFMSPDLAALLEGRQAVRASPHLRQRRACILVMRDWEGRLFREPPPLQYPCLPWAGLYVRLTDCQAPTCSRSAAELEWTSATAASFCTLGPVTTAPAFSRTLSLGALAAGPSAPGGDHRRGQQCAHPGGYPGPWRTPR